MLKRILQYFFPKKNPQHNIGLYGDLDDVEIIMEVERALRVKFTNEEAAAIRTVGQFFDATQQKMAERSETISWQGFLGIIECHSRLPITEVRRDTQFFRYI